TIRSGWCSDSARSRWLPVRVRLRPIRRSALRAAIVLVAPLAAALGIPATAIAQEELLQELKKISSVRIEGRHHLGAGTLRRAMKTRGPSLWPWSESPLLRFDYLRADVTG